MGRLVVGLLFLPAFAACVADDDLTCEVDAAMNTCTADSDCVLASCATDCCDGSAIAYSVNQVRSASCLVPLDESASQACLDWASPQCPDVMICLSDPSVKAGCREGVCVVRYM